MGLYGMDVDSGRRLSEQLGRAGERLLALSANLTPAIAAAPWDGRDAARFKDDWTRQRQQLVGAGLALKAASSAVRRNVEEQLAASASGSTGPGAGGSTGPGGAGGGGSPAEGSLLDRLAGAVAGGAVDLWKQGGRALAAVDDVAEALAGAAPDTGWNWLQDHAPLPIRNLMDAQANLLHQAGHVGDMGWRWLTAGEPPSLTELASNRVLLGAGALSLAATVLTGGWYNPRLLDDGRPVAGEPLPVAVGDPAGIDQDLRFNTPVPSSISAILQATNAAYGDEGKPGTPDAAVRITTVHKPGQADAYIVSIPGTTRWYPDGAANPTDLTGNLELAGGNLSTAAESVRLAMEKAGIPPGSPVMLSGHSQGGMIAAALASDGSFTDRFHVTNVVTFGSPVDSAPIPAGIDVLALQHAGDPVPRVDLGDLTVGAGGDVTASRDNGALIVTMPNPDVPPGAAGIGYHDGGEYVRSTGALEHGGPIADYAQRESTRHFLTTDPGQVSSSVSSISRKQ
ncbi:PGAP1-like alpha/beta domain-containing protein [Arthrobacter sp. Hor0625]|uniref:PGAP1-like alpha/beta domain-containing protein n=1 Tax=Arthrobacter sp. Hor0625 TaxID=3457358 RepID=UPI00403E4AE8